MHQKTTTAQQLTSEQLDELRLFEELAAGSHVAFEKIYTDMAPRVFGLVLRLLKDRAQAEEVTQEIFVEIWQHASTYDPGKGRPSTWIMTISHRRAIDRIRASESSHRRDIKIGAQEFALTQQDISEDVATHMEAQRVTRAMTRLTELQRQVISLVYYGGLSQKEVAEKLSVPVNTIKTRLRDGMIRLRDELEVVS